MLEPTWRARFGGREGGTGAGGVEPTCPGAQKAWLVGCCPQPVSIALVEH